MAIIARALASLFGPEEFRVLFLGLDASGRTTMLYKLKLGEVVTTIPTIGFNVETLVVQGTSMTVWDVGGCDKIRPLWRHYFKGCDAVAFFVDSNDRDRVQEVKEELARLMAEPELQGCILQVLASKQDLPGCMSVDEVRGALQLADVEHRVQAQVTCMPISLERPDTYHNAMEWLAKAIPQRRKQRGSVAAQDSADAPGKAAVKPKGLGEDLEEVLQRWLEVEDGPDDAFLAALENFTLDSWDHRTHLRVAWLLLTRHGRREGMARIFSGIKAFIENSPRTKRASGRGTTFHETMTYFWTHFVHYALVATKNPKGDFKTFLLLNPQLANGGLFLHYYSKKLMLHSSESRERVVLPDKRPLPSLLSDVQQMKSRVGAAAAAKPAKQPEEDTDDDAFLACFEARQLRAWGHPALLRVIYCYLGRLGRRRAVDKVFEELRALQKDGFNATLTYFWVQMMTAALVPAYRLQLFPESKPAAGLPQALDAVSLGSDTSSSTGTSELGQCKLAPAASTLPPFTSLASGQLGPVSLAVAKLVAEPQMYLKHYSKALVHSKAAAEGFVLPDIKALPSVV